MASCRKDWKGAAPFLGEHLALLREDFSFSGYERDLVCLNRGDGTFLDISGASGADSVTDGRAAVFLDYDDDGDTDIFLRAMHGRAHLLFRNEVGHARNWIRIALQGTASGRDAFGAWVRATTSAGRIVKLKSGGSGFLAQHDPRVLIGLGDDDEAKDVVIVWPSGRVQRVGTVRAGTTLRLVEPRS